MTVVKRLPIPAAILATCGATNGDVAGGKYRELRKFSVGPNVRVAFLRYDAAGEETPPMRIITTGPCGT